MESSGSRHANDTGICGFFIGSPKRNRFIDTTPNDTHTIGRFYGVNGKKLLRQYKDYQSGFRQWDQKRHAKQWLLYAQNMGTHLSIDETSLSDGELYTILTNKAAKGRNGSIIAIIAGTKAETVIEILRKIPLKTRKKVSEITLDMAGNMALIAKRCFPSATQVTDRFHVQKLASEALQEIRIKYRWQAIEAENEAIEQAKATQTAYQPEVLSNGDTVNRSAEATIISSQQICALQKGERLDRDSKTKGNITF
ncbi:ISAon1 family transposase [Runella aurantiaca]|uniref:ISAon1 family transposase n=1 Tax=Runella aurantiaca TaxID=2282308 RepID=UPI00404503C7